jgi:hypothetical protein
MLSLGTIRATWIYFVNKMQSFNFRADGRYIYHWAIKFQFFCCWSIYECKMVLCWHLPCMHTARHQSLLMMMIAYLKFIRSQFCVSEFRLKASFMGMNIADGCAKKVSLCYVYWSLKSHCLCSTNPRMLHVSYSVLDTRTSGIIYSIPSGSDRAVNLLHYLGFTRQLQWLAQGGESDKQNLTVGGKGENPACILWM